MKKYGLLSLIAVMFCGCLYSGGEWSKGLKDKRSAIVCGKEVVQVSSPDDSRVMQSEYRVQLKWDWNDVEDGAHPIIWSVVGEKTYNVLNISDEVSILPVNFGQMKGHVTVIFYWTDDRVVEINEFKYEYDLPEDWPGR